VERRHSLARHVAGKAVPDRAQQDCRSGADFGGSGERWIAEHKFRPDHDWRREDSNRVGDPADFLPWFADWPFGWLDVAELIQAAEACFEYPMVARDPLDRRMFGRVTLMGDAAHPMHPIGSNGASEGILDPRVLARELRRAGHRRRRRWPMRRSGDRRRRRL
jgi:2-polyprenyl-6-methoxyphenol hydroxylase-like FAD-dependent oxidoreductase